MHDKIHTHLKQVEKYRFETSFDEWDGKVVMDEPAPLGESKGPNAAMMISSAVGHCLCASLVFCAGKAHGEFEGVSADVETTLMRNDRGRWRIEGIKVDIKAVVDDENQKKTERCKELFEDFCIVTSSVRQGIKVDVDLSMIPPEQ
ncbi:MAG TPA: OsmC family protein [Thermoplasmata archaeon]|nr:OsmC family protein [Thermoplasmata archaeon]HUV60737.1 OsmC family protein [Thermoplasmata archaeon]